jgi:hypothetical protein
MSIHAALAPGVEITLLRRHFTVVRSADLVFHTTSRLLIRFNVPSHQSISQWDELSFNQTFCHYICQLIHSFNLLNVNLALGVGLGLNIFPEAVEPHGEEFALWSDLW